MVYKNEKAKITAVACYWEDFQNNQLTMCMYLLYLSFSIIL